MIALLQRVSSASVAIEGTRVASIARGLLVLIGVERGDSESTAERLAERILKYRVFPDDDGRMNRSLSEMGGDLLLVPQFTLAADTASGNRPGFSTAAAPELGEALFKHFVTHCELAGQTVQTGQFGADMQVTLCNDGPVTFNLRVAP